MRRFLFVSLILVFLLTSFSSFASYNGPILSKTKSPGFTPEHVASGLQCQLYANKIVITKSVGSIYITTEQEAEIGGKVQSLIALALSAKEQTVVGPTDVPTTTYITYVILPNDKVEHAILGQSGEKIVRRDSNAARQLINFLDKVCGD